MANQCQVWVRPLGAIATKVRVAGLDNANWLRGTLQNKGVECTEPMELRDSPFCTFIAVHVNQIEHPMLMELMKQVPEIELMFEPA